MAEAEAPRLKSRAGAQEPTDAVRKLEYLVRDVVPRRVLGHQPSMASFSDATGIARSTLRLQLDQGRLTGHVQAILAEKLSFSLGWDEWLTGTAEEFSCRYRSTHERAVLAESDRARRAVQLVEDEQFVDSEKVSSDLAMLALFVPTNAPSAGVGEANISFTLYCPKFVAVDFECGVEAGWLEFDLGAGSTTEVKDRQGFGDGVTINQARFVVHDPDFHKPSWWVEALKGQRWIGMVVDVPAGFLLARNLAPGDCIRGRFRVCVSEIGVSFSLPEGRAEKVAKTKLKNRLKTLQIVGDNDGKATVAANSIRLKAKATP